MRTARFAVFVVVAAVLTGCGGSGEPETVNGCVIEPSAGCANLDLSGADLEGADLSDADLSGANLEGTNLSGADLTGANLNGANLNGAQLVDTDLSDADLTSANLIGATITVTDLDAATRCDTTLTDGAIDNSGCPDTTDTTEASDAEVTSFDVSDLDCGAATTGPVTITWETENATAVEIGVDTASPTTFGPTGSTTVVVACDGEPHEITITPQNGAGPGAPETEEVGSD